MMSVPQIQARKSQNSQNHFFIIYFRSIIGPVRAWEIEIHASVRRAMVDREKIGHEAADFVCVCFLFCFEKIRFFEVLKTRLRKI